jgi:hypothetical protein
MLTAAAIVIAWIIVVIIGALAVAWIAKRFGH